jgi:hypothetical protein
MAGYSRADTGVETPVKLNVVGPDQRGCGSLWRREKIRRATDHELDDVAFLTGSNDEWEMRNSIINSVTQFALNDDDDDARKINFILLAWHKMTENVGKVEELLRKLRYEYLRMWKRARAFII